MSAGRAKYVKHMNFRQAMRQVNRGLADDDWDGASSSAQIVHNYRHIPFTFLSTARRIYADQNTIVLDKKINRLSTGVLIDHHFENTDDALETNPLLSYLSFALNNRPTSRLVFRELDERPVYDRFVGLLLSSIAEITDGFYRLGEEDGSLSELKSGGKIGNLRYFMPARIISGGLLRDIPTFSEKEIYSMADILNLVARRDPAYALRLGVGFYERLPIDAQDLLETINSHDSTKTFNEANSFVKCMAEFRMKSFEHFGFGRARVRILDNETVGGFGRYVIEKVRRAVPGNYVLFRGTEVSIRTKYSDVDSGMVIAIRNVLNENDLIQNERGRRQGASGAYRFTLNERITYERFKGLLRGSLIVEQSNS
jgi:hypothetical protein